VAEPSVCRSGIDSAGKQHPISNKGKIHELSMDIGYFRYDNRFSGLRHGNGKRSFDDTGEFSSGIG